MLYESKAIGYGMNGNVNSVTACRMQQLSKYEKADFLRGKQYYEIKSSD